MLDETATTEEVASTEEITTDEAAVTENEETPVAEEAVQEPPEVPEKYSKLSQEELLKNLMDKDAEITRRAQREAELRKLADPLTQQFNTPQSEYVPQDEADAALQAIADRVVAKLEATQQPYQIEQQVMNWGVAHADDPDIANTMPLVVARVEAIPEAKRAAMIQAHPEGLAGVLEDTLARVERENLQAIRAEAKREGKKEVYDSATKKRDAQPESASTPHKSKGSEYTLAELNALPSDEYRKIPDSVKQEAMRRAMQE